MQSTYLFLVPLITVGLLVAGCGSSSPTATPTETPAPALDGTPEPTIEFTPTPLPTDVPEPASSSRKVVEPDPDYEDELRRAGLSTGVWETDFSLHTVPYDQIFSGGVGRDGIPPIDAPKFVSVQEADEWLAPLEPVIALEVNGVSKAYPLQILTWHEIANDEIGGVPVAVTFCPLCNSAIVFDRRLDGVVYDFGVSGNLRNSDLIMWDRQTQSWWQQLSGESIVGELAGARLSFIPAQMVAWETYKQASSGTQVLSRDTGFRRNYGRNPYVGYDRVDQPPFLFFGETDGRLPPKARVAAVALGGVDVAFPYPILAEERAVNYTVGGQDIAVFYEPGTRSALDASSIAASRDVGATGVFDPVLDGRSLTFTYEGSPEEGMIVDEQTGSTWSILGEATDGPLVGSKLRRIVHQDHFWFAWAAFKPDTKVYSGSA